MENEQKKSNDHRNIYATVVVILLLAVIGCTLRGCGNDTDIKQLHKNTDAAMERIETEHAAVRRELDAASGQLDAAGETLGRADDLIDRSQERVAENANSLADCQRIVSECRKIVADCQRICSEVEEANRSRAGSGS